MQQQTGNNTPISHVLTGSVGLNLALIILPADQGKRSASRDDQDSSGLHRGNGGAQRSFSAVASGSTDATLGATLDRRMAGRMQWGDIESDRAGTVAIEHTFSATAGSFLDGVLVPACKT